MSLVMISSSELTRDENYFVQLVKEKTGLEITWESSSYSRYNGLKLKFPDMEEGLSVSGDVAYFNSSSMTTFIDVETHFMVNINSAYETSMTSGSYDLKQFFYNIIFESDGALYCPISNAYSTACYGYACFNFPSVSLGTDDTNTITLLPCIHVQHKKKPVIKNLFINLNKRYVTGLHLKDNNGNEFITLGNYFLYKIN